MKDTLRDRLESLVARHTQLQRELSHPDAAADRERYRESMSELARLAPIAECYEKHCHCEQELEALGDMRPEETPDAEWRTLVGEEREQLTQRIQALETELKGLLMVPDPYDSRNVFLEIRAGTGGEEAALFAADLYRMYARYAERQNWSLELLSAHESEQGGFREVVTRIQGKDAYAHLKFESGTHRVQRIPKTESQGRIHTSAATVAVLPEAEAAVELEIPAEDLRIDRFRASGAGGQHLNKTDSAVRITHLPTGLSIECQNERSQHRNKEQALSLLRALLLDQERQRRTEEESSRRRALVGSGDRSERIRTYNFPQSRLTDHRIGLTVYSLQEVLEGELEEIIEPLRHEFRSESLQETSEDLA